jgi:orotidine-5'-phosphate decarboxylase
MTREEIVGRNRSAPVGGADRLIVALDVPDHEKALAIVQELDNVSFFKIGLQLFLSGDILALLKKLQDAREGEGGVFIDLKLSGDIGHTISRFIERSAALNVKFITLAEAVPKSRTIATIQVARETRGDNAYPHLLMVPMLSSLDGGDLPEHPGGSSAFIVSRGREMLDHGCDGLIVSGEAIRACRKEFQPDINLVSPGIRPEGFPAQDHKRYTTPTKAIKYGADYLVVGRPILQARNRRLAAQNIIDEIDNTLGSRELPSASIPLGPSIHDSIPAGKALSPDSNPARPNPARSEKADVPLSQGHSA